MPVGREKLNLSCRAGKTTDQNYETDAKKSARELLLSFVDFAPARIFTLPGKQAYCARIFRDRWPSSEIVGIERQTSVVRCADLDEWLDHFFNISFHEVVDSKAPRIKSPKLVVSEFGIGQPIRQMENVNQGGTYDYGVFDLAYLDFCGKPTGLHMKDVCKFFDQRVVSGGVVGLTFDMRTHSVSRLLETIKKTMRFSKMAHLSYQTRTNMILVVLKKS